LTYKCLEKFNTDKRKEVEELRNDYEVFCIENLFLRKLLDSFVSTEISSCDMRNYPSD